MLNHTRPDAHPGTKNGTLGAREVMAIADSLVSSGEYYVAFALHTHTRMLFLTSTAHLRVRRPARQRIQIREH